MEVSTNLRTGWNIQCKWICGYSDIFQMTLQNQSYREAGVLGMLPSIIGNIQALEAIKLIIDLKPNLIGRLLVYDGLQHKTEIIKL